MAEGELPKAGDSVPVESFHVSPMNVRYGQPFGEAEEDKTLIFQLRRGKIVGPFKARPEGDGFGVVVGRRRFLAKKESGAKTFVVGKDCLIEEMTDEEAKEASLIENLKILRKDMDPITRAEVLNEIVSLNPAGLRSTARHLGIAPSTLSEYLKPLELAPEMQEKVRKGLLSHNEALHFARLGLGAELQTELAETLESEGKEAFEKEVARRVDKGARRGRPKGKYEESKLLWDVYDREDTEPYGIITQVAERKNMKVPDYIKDFLKRHIEDIRLELS